MEMNILQYKLTATEVIRLTFQTDSLFIDPRPTIKTPDAVISHS